MMTQLKRYGNDVLVLRYLLFVPILVQDCKTVPLQFCVSSNTAVEKAEKASGTCMYPALDAHKLHLGISTLHVLDSLLPKFVRERRKTKIVCKLQTFNLKFQKDNLHHVSSGLQCSLFLHAKCCLLYACR